MSSVKDPHLKLALITPARNEAEHIEKVIQSVIVQKCLPEKWIIVSDGSTDGTDDIVKKYLLQNNWMELVRRPEHLDRNWASKAHCFNAGYAVIDPADFDAIGNLDADITLGDDEFIGFFLNKLAQDSTLGVVGAPFVEGTSHYDYRFTNVAHVSGACQIFRRECFEEIGGYTPIKGGGIDWVAVTTARMNGWQTRTFTEKICYHHRPMGTGNYYRLATAFKHGQKDYFLGGHPLWQIFRSFYQMRRKPYLVGGLSMLLGYFWSMIKRTKRPVTPELIKFHRNEQILRLRSFFMKAFKLQTSV